MADACCDRHERLVAHAQRHQCGSAVQHDIGGQIGQIVRVSDMASFGETGPQQTFLHRGPVAVILGEMDQLMRLGGVRDIDVVQAITQPVRLGGRCHLLTHGGDLRRADAQMLHQIFGLRAGVIDGRVGVQFKTVIFDLDQVAVEIPQRGFQPALADIASGTGNIGADFNLDGIYH